MSRKTAILGQALAECGGGAHALATQILGNRDDAADAVHDAIVKVLQRPETYDAKRGGLRPWFLRVVRHRCIDLLRRRRPTDTDVESIADGAASPEGTAIAQQDANRLQSALARLPAAHREILVLRDFNDLDYADIARVLDIPKGTVMSRLHRARLALRKEINHDEH